MIANLAIAIGLAGIGYVWLDETISRTRTQTSISGLFMEIEATRWLKSQMDHGKVIPMPQSMMPDLPDHGYQRLSVELVIYNKSDSLQTFRADELFLCSTENQNWPAVSSSIPEIVLSPGQLTNFYLQFDVPHEMTGALHLEWQRRGVKRRLSSVPRPVGPPMDHSMANVREPGDYSLVSLVNTGRSAAKFPPLTSDAVPVPEGIRILLAPYIRRMLNQDNWNRMDQVKEAKGYEY